MYLKINPDPELKHIVEGIWVQEDHNNTAPGDNTATTVLPVPKIDFLFHYLDPFIEVTDQEEKELPKFFICGHRTKPVKVKAKGKTGIIIVSMYPWGASKFLNEPVNCLTNQSIDLFEIYHAGKLNYLQDVLISDSPVINKVNAVQSFPKKAIKETRNDRLVSDIVANVNSYQGNISITRLAEHYSMSRRHLTRIFRNVVGLSPKEFSKIIRFQKAVYAQRAGLNWERISFNLGYYDQPHYIKEIKQYTGKSPRELSNNFNSTKLQTTFNNASGTSNLYTTVYL